MDISPETRRISEMLSSRGVAAESWPWEIIEDLQPKDPAAQLPTSVNITVEQVSAATVDREFTAPFRIAAGTLVLSVAGSLAAIPATAEAAPRHEHVVVAESPAGGSTDPDEIRKNVAEKVGEVSDAAKKLGGRISDKVKHKDEQTAAETDQPIDKDKLNQSVRGQDTTNIPGNHFHNADGGAAKDTTKTQQPTGTPKVDKPVIAPAPLPTTIPSATPDTTSGTTPDVTQAAPVDRSKQPVAAQPKAKGPKNHELKGFPSQYNPKPVDFHGTQVVFPVNLSPGDIAHHPKAWDYKATKNYHHAENNGVAFLAADIQALSGTAIESPVNGKVVQVVDDGQNPNGSRVDVLADNGKYVFVMTHLARGVAAKKGMAVKIGESTIGVLNDFGPDKKYDSHLHIEVLDARTGKRLEVQDLMRNAFAAQSATTGQQPQTDPNVGAVSNPNVKQNAAPPATDVASKLATILKNRIPEGHFVHAEGTAPVDTIAVHELPQTVPDLSGTDGSIAQNQSDSQPTVIDNGKSSGNVKTTGPDDLSRVREILKNVKPGQALQPVPGTVENKVHQNPNKQTHGQQPGQQAEKPQTKATPEVTSKAASIVTRDVVKKMMPGVRDEVLGVCYPLVMKALEERGIDSVDMALYAFATIKIETGVTINGKNMTCAPIEEIGKGGGRYRTGTGNYYGRGYIQLTWAYNYRSYGRALGVDLIHNPSKALDPDVAARVLAMYLYRNKDRLNRDFAQKNIADARRVVNGGTNGLWSFKQSLNAGKRAIGR